MTQLYFFTVSGGYSPVNGSIVDLTLCDRPKVIHEKRRIKMNSKCEKNRMYSYIPKSNGEQWAMIYCEYEREESYDLDLVISAKSQTLAIMIAENFLNNFLVPMQNVNEYECPTEINPAEFFGNSCTGFSGIFCEEPESYYYR